MPFDQKLADRIREYLSGQPHLEIEEKKMFGGLAFMINGKMCVNVSGNDLMCRFDPDLTQEVAAKNGYRPMVMKGKEYKGYCYVAPTGFKNRKDFEYWMKLCLDFNRRSKSSKKSRSKL